MSFVDGSHNTHRGSTAAESKLNLLIRYLDHTVNDDQLRRFFVEFGDVTSSMVMRDILTGESRGFGFVRFARHSDAARAMSETDGKRIGGKAVNVLWAKQQHDRTPAGQDRLKMNKLFLRNVPMDVSEQQLTNLVRRFGTVVEVSLHNDKISTAYHAPSRRIAFIVFGTDGAAEAALHAVHNTCPFRGCHDIPLMAKLSEDYKAKPNPSEALASRPPRLSSVVTTVPAMRTPVEQSSCCVSTPNSTTGRSPGISSLVPSLESASLDVSAPQGFGPLTVMELDGSLPSSHLTPRTPLYHLSADARLYRHNPYGSVSMMPAMLTSCTLCTSALMHADSPTVLHTSRRVST